MRVKKIAEYSDAIQFRRDNVKEVLEWLKPNKPRQIDLGDGIKRFIISNFDNDESIVKEGCWLLRQEGRTYVSDVPENVFDSCYVAVGQE